MDKKKKDRTIKTMRYDRNSLQKKGIPHLPGDWEFRELAAKKKWLLKNYPGIMNTHGGAGRNQGRKLKFNEETTTLSVRVPVSKKRNRYDAAPLWKKINISDNEKGYYVNSNTGIVLFRFRGKLENYLKNLPEKKQQ